MKKKYCHCLSIVLISVKTIKTYNQDIGMEFKIGLVSLINNISAFIGYLMPKPSL